MLAIVILNYNGKAFLERFLPTVLAYSKRADTAIYVADNASTDDSVAYLRTAFPNVFVQELKENYGFAEGYNQSLRSIVADYYLLLNSDVEVTDGWLAPLLTLMENDATVAAVQPKILSFHEKHLFEHAGGAGGWLDVLGYPLCKGRILATLETDKGQYNTQNDAENECFWATGACMLVRASLFHALGGFDGDYFAHMEEIDWCWRAKRAGYRIMSAPEAVVYHVGGGTLPKTNPRKTYLNFKNSLITILKNAPCDKVFWIIPTRLFLDGIAGMVFLTEGKFQDIRMIVKAHWHFFAAIPHTMRKRKIANEHIEQQRIAEPNYIGWSQKSIIVEYYIKGKKIFEGY
jgi:GT2 family glycosyltransferase